jgi:dCTP deaminase
MLVDHQIRAAIDSGDLIVTPDDDIENRIQPASLDVRLGDTFLCFTRYQHGLIDPKLDTSSCWNSRTVNAADPDAHYVVHPGELVLASTLERIQLPDTLVARVEGKSSLGRLGLLVHATAGYIDPGWSLGTITLEISTVVGVPVKLYPGMPIAQLSFMQTDAPKQAYAGKYVGQHKPTPSRFHKNWTGTRWI